MRRLRVDFQKLEARAVRVTVHRPDGPPVADRVPGKGSLPHDLVHLVVEESLGLRNAFWGRVSDGASFRGVGEIAKAGGHASSKRSRDVASDVVELVQAERIVECFEAELDGGPTDTRTLNEVLAAGCRESAVPAPIVADEAIRAIRSRLLECLRDWRELPVGAALSMDWP